MREILFKAKRKDNGEWVEGLLWKKKYDSNKIFISCFPDKDDNEEVFVVDPDTICQYTGLTDKNGRKIWEHDIVRHYNVPWEPTQFTKGVIYWSEENLRHERSSEYTPEKPATVNSSCIYEVIGNVFDNSELLEKAR